MTTTGDEHLVACPVCGSATFVDSHTPASDHPECSTDRRECETCDWHSDEWPTPNSTTTQESQCNTKT